MKNKHTFFWASYTDLMTSLFFLMLILYVFSYFLLQERGEKWERLKEIQESIKKLDNGTAFIYEEQYKRHRLKKNIKFAVGRADIPAEDSLSLLTAGKELVALIDSVKNISVKDVKINYLIVIEGMASDDKFSGNYELSYQRAKSVYEFWVRHKLKFDPDVSEIMIAGSGVGGVGRSSKQTENQRIMVQIIPKTGSGGKS
jgi:hypothetical protein